ncbi:MAG TPA: arsenate reductase (glutaredoxin) [Aliidiomarina sp.]|nr:arsenate reductase (glutaredoxin) [Aliidiomarina sp.]
MTAIVIFHNPRCSKSRETLALLQEQGIEPQIIEYLKTPPTAAQLKQTLVALGMSAKDLLRSGEDEYKTLELANFSGSEDALIELMCAHPKLIERPIVINGNKAKVGRPPETVLQIL